MRRVEPRRELRRSVRPRRVAARTLDRRVARRVRRRRGHAARRDEVETRDRRRRLGQQGAAVLHGQPRQRRARRQRQPRHHRAARDLHGQRVHVGAPHDRRLVRAKVRALRGAHAPRGWARHLAGVLDPRRRLRSGGMAHVGRDRHHGGARQRHDRHPRQRARPRLRKSRRARDEGGRHPRGDRQGFPRLRRRVGSRQHRVPRRRRSVLPDHARASPVVCALGLRSPVLRAREPGRGRRVPRQPRRDDGVPADDRRRLRARVRARDWRRGRRRGRERGRRCDRRDRCHARLSTLRPTHQTPPMAASRPRPTRRAAPRPS